MDAEAFGVWTARLFCAAIGVLDFAMLSWETFVRHGIDSVITPTAIFLMIVPLLGPAAAKYLRAK